MAAGAKLNKIVTHCDKILKTREFLDWKGAVNGLQVENDGTVTRIAAAVDGSLRTIEMAIEACADLLIVHHGLFWGPSHPWTGKKYRMLKLLLDNNLAVYSSHLPLDAHPKLGNNAGLCSALGFKVLTPFFFQKERYLGLQAARKIKRDKLMEKLEKVLGGKPTLLPGGPETCQKIGVVTGGAGSELYIAKQEGVDTFITGEGPHHTFGMAEDLEINVIYGGHYATETFGVKALAQHLSEEFKVTWTFLDHPSGL